MQFPYNPSKDKHHATEDYGTASFTNKHQILQHLVEEEPQTNVVITTNETESADEEQKEEEETKILKDSMQS